MIRTDDKSNRNWNSLRESPENSTFVIFNCKNVLWWHLHLLFNLMIKKAFSFWVRLNSYVGRACDSKYFFAFFFALNQGSGVRIPLKPANFATFSESSWELINLCQNLYFGTQYSFKRVWFGAFWRNTSKNQKNMTFSIVLYD